MPAYAPPAQPRYVAPQHQQPAYAQPAPAPRQDYAPPPPSQRPEFAPQFERYLNTPQPQQAAPQYGQPAPHYAAPDAPTARPRTAIHPAQRDPAAGGTYDLSAYATPPPPAPPSQRGGYDPAYAQHAVQQQAPQPHPGHHPQYAGRIPYTDAVHQSSLDPQALRPVAPDAIGSHPQGQPGDEVFVDEAEEPPRRGRRSLMIAGALVGSICIGVGLALAYKNFGASKQPSSREAMVVRAPKGPTKTPPSEPGGKEFAHTDKKFMNRLGEERKVAAAPPERERVIEAPQRRTEEPDPTAPRKVESFPINPVERREPPQVRDVEPPREPPRVQPRQGPQVAFPGVAIDNIGPPPRGPASPPEAAPRRPLAPPAPPVTTSVAPPRPLAEPPAVRPPAPALPPPSRQIAVAPPSPPALPQRIRAPAEAEPGPAAEAPARKVRKPVEKPQQAAAAPGSPPRTGGGYVAWVSSTQSRLQALSEFANMQQKHGPALIGKQPLIEEANLGEKGTWYRLRIGPAGTKEAATDLCNKLKASGVKSCIVRAF